MLVAVDRRRPRWTLGRAMLMLGIFAAGLGLASPAMEARGERSLAGFAIQVVVAVLLTWVVHLLSQPAPEGPTDPIEF